MKNLIVSLLLLLTSCPAWADSSTVVELPSQYTSAQVEAFIHSLDFPQLTRDADRSVPWALKDHVGYYFQALAFHSFTGRPDHMAIRVDVHAVPSWGKESELKAFLVNYLVKRFPGSQNTATVLIP